MPKKKKTPRRVGQPQIFKNTRDKPMALWRVPDLFEKIVTLWVSQTSQKICMCPRRRAFFFLSLPQQKTSQKICVSRTSCFFFFRAYPTQKISFFGPGFISVCTFEQNDKKRWADCGTGRGSRIGACWGSEAWVLGFDGVFLGGGYHKWRHQRRHVTQKKRRRVCLHLLRYAAPHCAQDHN